MCLGEVPWLANYHWCVTWWGLFSCWRRGKRGCCSGEEINLIIAMIFSTVQLPAFLPYTKACSVIQRDAAIPANHFIPGHKGWVLQPALEKEMLAKVAKKPFASVLPVIY